MSSSLSKKYNRGYSIAAALILLIIPAASYGLFSRYHLLKTLPLFRSATAWSAGVVLVWFLGFLSMKMAVNWDDKIDQTFQKKGFKEHERVKIVWNLALMPAILGCLFTLYYFLETPSPGQEYAAVRLLILFLGFVPVTLYGLVGANRITDRIFAGEHGSKELPSDYLQGKWWPFIVVIMTMLLTPFFGAGIAAAQIWRLAPRYRHLLYVVIVLSGFIITLLLAPLVTAMRKIKQGEAEAYQAFALYSTLTLFTGMAYVLIIKLGALFKKKDVRDL